MNFGFVIDNRRCIACKSCMQACPYDALYIDPETHTAAKCNYCAHRIDYGVEHGLEGGVHPLATPACGVSCPAECRIFGDLDDPESNVSRYLTEKGPGEVLRPAARTAPKTKYVHLQ